MNDTTFSGFCSASTLLGKDEGEGILSGYFHWHHLFLCEQ